MAHGALALADYLGDGLVYGLLGGLLAGYGAALGLLGGTGAMMALAALAAATALLLVAVNRALPVETSGSALRSCVRERTEQTMFLRQRDPDAAGRPHPRAPSVQPTAA